MRKFTLFVITLILLGVYYYITASAEVQVIEYEKSAAVYTLPTTAEKIDDFASITVSAPTMLLMIGQISYLLQFAPHLSTTEFFSFFTSVFLKIKSIKKNLWGMVLNSTTLKPLPFVVIRAHDFKTDTIIYTTVSDLEGRYSLIPQKGQYYLTIEHQDYKFNAKAKNRPYKAGQEYYYGEYFEPVLSTNYSFNILLDPVKFKLGFNIKVFQYIWKQIVKLGKLFQNLYFITIIFFLNLFLMIVFEDNAIYLVLSILYGLLILLNLYHIIFPQKPRSWGAVIENKTNRPIMNAFLKLFNKKDEKLFDTKVSDRNGYYQFFVPDGSYELISQASGYDMDKRDVVISKEPLIQVIVLNKILSLKKDKKIRFGS